MFKCTRKLFQENTSVLPRYTEEYHEKVQFEQPVGFSKFEFEIIQRMRELTIKMRGLFTIDEHKYYVYG
jgi:hypothetical protein